MTAIGSCVCATVVLLGCQPPEAQETSDVQEAQEVRAPSADHHVHIRSAEAASHLDAIGVEQGERSPDDEPSEAIGADELITALDAAGLTRALVLSNAYQFGMPEHPAEREYELVVSENEYVADQAAQYPERLVALCSFNPLRPYAEEELERCANDDRVGGLKLHFTNSDVDLRNEEHLQRVGDIFQEADRLGLSILVHMRTRAEDYGEVDATAFIERVLSRTQAIHVQIAHMAGWGGYDAGTDAALGAFADAIAAGTLDGDRVSFGLGAVVFDPSVAGADTVLAERVRSSNEMLADRIRQIGVTRVVYATDWPSWPPVADRTTGIERNVRLIRQALPLTESEMEQVLSNVSPLLR